MAAWWVRHMFLWVSRPKKPWVSVLPWWLGVSHKHDCFNSLSGPLPTSYTSRFTDAYRWSKELRKYVGLIRFCLVTRIIPRMLFCFWKGVGLRIPLYFGSSFIAHIVRCEAKRLRCLRLLLSSSKSLIKHFERPYEPLSKAHQLPGETIKHDEKRDPALNYKEWSVTWEMRREVTNKNKLQEMVHKMKDCRTHIWCVGVS